MFQYFFGSCAFVPLGLAVKYPKELRLVLLLRNLGAFIHGVHIGKTLGWDVETCGVLWSHSLALRPSLTSCGNPILSLYHSIVFYHSPQIFYK